MALPYSRSVLEVVVLGDRLARKLPRLADRHEGLSEPRGDGRSEDESARLGRGDEVERDALEGLGALGEGEVEPLAGLQYPCYVAEAHPRLREVWYLAHVVRKARTRREELVHQPRDLERFLVRHDAVPADALQERVKLACARLTLLHEGANRPQYHRRLAERDASVVHDGRAQRIEYLQKPVVSDHGSPHIRMYFAMNTTVSTYIIQWMRLNLKASALMTVYEMTPNMMPSEME